MIKIIKNFRFIAVGLVFAFLANSLAPVPMAQAQDFILPKPGIMVSLSPAFTPAMLKGIKVHTDNPFRFDFILDKGDSQLGQDQLKDESSKLIKYFLASLTIPEKDLWVNLSPYEKDRIVPEFFGQTEMGRDLLAEDYMLKQITASLIYPEGETGKKFWKRIYEEANKKFGTTNIPVNTFNKVWIVPEKAVVYENAKAGTAYVVESKLKVMLEQDYLSLQKHEGISGEVRTQGKETNQLGSQIVREIVIPELTKEVNENKSFAQLRQVYNSLILATWYKKKIKDSILSQVYADKNKVAGVNITDPQEKERIYQRYLQAFKKGVYNFIKEEVDPISQETVPRKYFSGGAWLCRILRTISIRPYPEGFGAGKNFAQLSEVSAGLKSIQTDQAMNTQRFNAEIDRIAAEKGVILGPNTKVTLFIGGPHIQNGYYYNLFDVIARRQYGFDMVYLPYPIEENDVDKVRLLKEQIKNNPRIVGGTITRPWKEEFYEKGDNTLGSVTFVIKNPHNEQVSRYATDGEAWLKGLNHDLGEDYDFSGKKVVILGSGGAARQIAETLNHKGKGLTVSFIDQDPKRLSGMQSMMEDLKPDYQTAFVVNQGAQVSAESDQTIARADLIINATGIGRKNTLGESPLHNHRVFHPGQVVVDLISDTETQILIEAKKQGVTQAYYGRSMFIYGMVLHMREWMQEFKTTQRVPESDELFQSISRWLDNYTLLGDKMHGVLASRIAINDGQAGHEVDIQIPHWMGLNNKITQATFVFDISKTLTPSGPNPISGLNLEQLVRAVKLKETRPDLKIKIILISGNAYKRFVTSRFAPRVADFDWDKIKSEQRARGIKPEVVDEVKAELQEYLLSTHQSAESVGAFLTIGSSIEQRVINVIMERLKVEKIALNPDTIQVITATGGEEATFDKSRDNFVYKKNETVFFNEKEQLEASRSLAINYLKALGIKLHRNFEAEIIRLKQAKDFLGSEGVYEFFKKATEGMGVVMLPFDHETHIVFNNPEFAFDGVPVALQAMSDFQKTPAYRFGVKYYPKGGSTFMIISLVDKSDQIEQRVKKDEIIVGGGDSTADKFLGDERFAQMLPIFFGTRERHDAEFPETILALDAHGGDAVYENGSGPIIRSVLDQMEVGGTWADVTFFNNQFSPRQVAILKVHDHVGSDSRDQAMTIPNQRKTLLGLQGQQISIDGKKIDIQIPRWMNLNKKVTQATFVFDIDLTLTPSNANQISDNNLDQLIRAIRLSRARPDLKIKIILISGSAYNRFTTSRFAKRISQFNWDEIKSQQKAQGVAPADVDAVKAEIEAYLHETDQSAGDVGVFLNIKGSIKHRVVDIIRDRLNRLKAEDGLDIDPNVIQVITSSGEETATYDNSKNDFVYTKNEAASFNDNEQLEVSRSLAINYLKVLGIKLKKSFDAEIAQLQQAKNFLGSKGVYEVFEKVTQGMDVEMLPFNFETPIVCHDPKYAVDGMSVAIRAMSDFQRTAAFRPQGAYFPRGGSNFSTITLFDKSDQIQRRVSKDEILVGGGDSTTDSFLWDTRFANQMLPMFFGKKEHVAQFPNVIVALDEHSQDAVYDKGSGKIMESVLDVMEHNETWDNVHFLSGQISPNQVESELRVDQAMTKSNSWETNLLGFRGKQINIDGKNIDIQIPHWMDLNKKVTQATFVFDIDKTLTPANSNPISGNNLEQLIRALKLRNTRPDLKIKIILISGSAYKRFAISRFAKRISQFNWDEIKSQQMTYGIQPAVVDEVKAEIEAYLHETGQSAENTGAFLNMKGSIEYRVTNAIIARIQAEGIELSPDAIQIITTTGGETATYDKDKNQFIYKKNEDSSFNDKEQLEVSRSLAINYFKALGVKLGRNFEAEINQLQRANQFLGSDGVYEVFERSTQGMNVEMLPFDHETHIVFHDPTYGFDGVPVVNQALSDFHATLAFRSDVKYYPKGGSNFILISLVDKSDQIEQRVKKDEILVGGGDSTTDGFLWDHRFDDQMLPMFFGKRDHVAQYPNVIVALDGDDHDSVYEAGSGKIIESVLDVMEQGKTWGDVAFLNDRYSPRQVALKLPDQVMNAGKIHFLFNNHSTFVQHLDQVRSRVKDADIILEETPDQLNDIYQEVSLGKLTPAQAKEEIEREWGSSAFNFPEMATAFLNMIYNSHKRVYGEPSNQEMERLRESSNNYFYNFIVNFMDGNSEQALNWYHRMFISLSRMYFIRDLAAKTQLEEIKRVSPEANILVIRGGAHSPLYEARKRDSPSDEITKEFLGGEGPYSLFEELGIEYSLQEFSLNEKKEFSDIQMIQAFISQIFAVVTPKRNPVALNQIIKRINSVDNFESLSVYMKNHPPTLNGWDLGNNELYKQIYKNICGWLITEKFTTLAELTAATDKDSAMGSRGDTGGIDLTPANMNLQTQNNGGEIKFHMDSAMLQQLQDAQGFVPGIINIQPLKNLQQFLGVNAMSSV